MKSKLTEHSDVNYVSEFTPTPIIYLPNGVGKLVWGFPGLSVEIRPGQAIHAYHLCFR